MGVKEWAIRHLDGIPRREHERIAARAYEAGIDDAEDEPISGTLSRYGYESLRNSGTREGKIDWAKRLDTAYALLESHPVAKRFAEIKRDHIIGGGAQIQCVDDEIQAICEQFWRVNEMDVHASEFAHQLYGLGAQLFTVAVRESDGAVRLGYVDPGQIDKIETDPDNAMRRVAVVVKPRQGSGWISSTDKRVYRIVQVAEGGEYDGKALEDKRVLAAQAERAGQMFAWETTMLAAYGKGEYDGDCLYFRVNSASNETLGHSDFICVADLLDQMDETLFALGEREQMAGFFSFDVALTGATPDQVTTRAHALRSHPPRRGSVNVHNENETWTMHAPDLRQSGSVQTVQEQLAVIAGACGYPVSWFGSGNETNLATAQAQGDPTWRSLAHDQGVVKAMLMELLLLARDQAILAGTYTPADDADIAVDLVMPEMTAKDLNSRAVSLSTLTSSLTVAVDQGWVSAQQAAEMWAKMASEFGVDIDLAEAPVADEEEGDEEGREQTTMPSRERVMALLEA